MGEVIYLQQPSQSDLLQPKQALGSLAGQENMLSEAEVKRLETIRDSIEDLLNMVAGVRRDPEAVALAAGRFGIMRMVQLHGREATLAFANCCADTAEMASDMFSGDKFPDDTFPDGKFPDGKFPG